MSVALGLPLPPRPAQCSHVQARGGTKAVGPQGGEMGLALDLAMPVSFAETSSVLWAAKSWPRLRGPF